MKWDLFKNKLKKEAQQQEDAVDIDALWSAIEPNVAALNEDKGKRSRLFFWIFFGVGLIFMTGWFALSNADVVMEAALSENEASMSDGGVLSVEEKLSNKLIAKSEKLENENDLLPVNSNGFQKNETVIAVDSENTKNGKRNKKNKHVKNIDQLLSSSQRNDNLFDSPLKTKLETNTSKDIQINLNKGSLTLEKEVAATFFEKDTPTIKTNEKDTKNVDLINKTINQINAISLLEKKENGLLLIKVDSLLEVVDFSSSRNFMDLDEKSKSSEPKFNFTVGLTSGLSYARRNLSQKNATGFMLLQNRENYESALETSHYGFFIGAKHKPSNLKITIGFQNTNIAEKYIYKDVQVMTRMVNGIQVRRINLEGDTIDIMGDVLENTTRTIDKKIYNSYRLLDIPVILSYDFPLQKMSLGIEAGILANLSLKTKGIVPDALLEDQDIDNSENGLFKSKVGLGYHFGLSISGLITEKIEWKVAPILRVYPSDFAGTSNELSQLYVLYGMNLGLAYSF